MSRIRHIETLSPGNSYSQDYLCEVMQTWASSKRPARIIKKFFDTSGINKRHIVIDDFGKTGPESRSLYHLNDEAREPTTGERNEVFIREAGAMAAKVSMNAIANCGSVAAEDITHLITVSCTGFSNPGPDFAVIDALGLSPAVERYHLGFMGCYAAFPGLRMADQFCRADPNATVLIVYIELCSLHYQLKEDTDMLLANSVFADGAAAVLVTDGGRAAEEGYELDFFASDLAREGEEDMAWDIGDNGFNIVLSKYIAKILGAGIGEIITRVLSRLDLSQEDIDLWAVHPGGRAILDSVESSLDIEPEQIAASRKVLAEYGNMSCVTILFILSEILSDPKTGNAKKVCAMAFGPGLTIETAVLTTAVET